MGSRDELSTQSKEELYSQYHYQRYSLRLVVRHLHCRIMSLCLAIVILGSFRSGPQSKQQVASLPSSCPRAVARRTLSSCRPLYLSLQCKPASRYPLQLPNWRSRLYPRFSQNTAARASQLLEAVEPFKRKAPRSTAHTVSIGDEVGAKVATANVLAVEERHFLFVCPQAVDRVRRTVVSCESGHWAVAASFESCGSMEGQIDIR